jgi:hypothetical protein
VNFSAVVDGAPLGLWLGKLLGGGVETTGFLVGLVVPLGDFDSLGELEGLILGVKLGKKPPGWLLVVGQELGAFEGSLLGLRVVVVGKALLLGALDSASCSAGLRVGLLVGVLDGEADGNPDGEADGNPDGWLDG